MIRRELLLSGTHFILRLQFYIFNKSNSESNLKSTFLTGEFLYLQNRAVWKPSYFRYISLYSGIDSIRSSVFRLTLITEISKLKIYFSSPYVFGLLVIPLDIVIEDDRTLVVVLANLLETH